jgi:hypothetical protein
MNQAYGSPNEADQVSAKYAYLSNAADTIKKMGPRISQSDIMALSKKNNGRSYPLREAS